MSLESKVNNALKTAMKEKNQGALRALRAIKSEILLFKTSGQKNKEFNEQEEIKILQKMIKQRKDSLAIYEEQSRADLASKEKEEIEVIQTFLPKQLSQEELESIIGEIVSSTGASSMKDMGRVMGLAREKIGGKADGKLIAQTVKSLLN